MIQISVDKSLGKTRRNPNTAQTGGQPEHLYEALTLGGADAALVASMLHYGEYTVQDIKQALHGMGVKMRMGG